MGRLSFPVEDAEREEETWHLYREKGKTPYCVLIRVKKGRKGASLLDVRHDGIKRREMGGKAKGPPSTGRGKRPSGH